jgi:hypothetical protein
MSRLMRVMVPGVFLVGAGCSIIPDIPGDYSLPINEILQHVACELRDAFTELRYINSPSFKATNWLIGISLTPKADRELIAGAGLTGKNTTDSKRTYFNTWSLGSSPAGQLDAKGTRNASVVYKIHSRDLFNPKKFLVACENLSPSYSVLAQHLGIHKWLVRTVTEKDRSVGGLASLETPTFTSEIFIKFTGSGTFTYNFPLGTDFASLSGTYDLDETLTIGLTPDQVKSVLIVQTLPTGGNFQDRPPDRVETLSRVDSQSKLDTLLTQQQIIEKLSNLQRR